MTKINASEQEVDTDRCAFMLKLIETYNVPIDLVRYETMDCDGSGATPTDET